MLASGGEYLHGVRWFNSLHSLKIKKEKQTTSLACEVNTTRLCFVAQDARPAKY